MIFHKYQQSTRRQICSERIDTFFKNMFDSVGLTYVDIFSKIIVPKYKDSTRRQHFVENIRRYHFLFFLGGGGQKQFKTK